jgi:hypothetical protein
MMIMVAVRRVDTTGAKPCTDVFERGRHTVKVCWIRERVIELNPHNYFLC